MPETADAYRYIMEEVIPRTVEVFHSKSKDYQGGPAFQFLGSKGQFSDINRKFWKLYAAVWEGKDLEGEQPIELLMDIIGHCWLTIYCLEQESRMPNSLPDFKDYLDERLNTAKMFRPAPEDPVVSSLMEAHVRHIPVRCIVCGDTVGGPWLVRSNYIICEPCDQKVVLVP